MARILRILRLIPKEKACFIEPSMIDLGSVLIEHRKAQNLLHIQLAQTVRIIDRLNEIEVKENEG